MAPDIDFHDLDQLPEGATSIAGMLGPGSTSTKTTWDKDSAISACYYTRLNLTVSEVVGGSASDEAVRSAWKLAVRYSHPDKGGSAYETKQVNLAKDVLSDNARRIDYKNALTKYGL